VTPVNEQIRPVDAELVLSLFRQARDEVTEMVHTARGDDRRDVRDALLHVAFRLEVLERDLGVRLGVNDAVPAPSEVREVGLNTAGRRLQGNGARHRARP
jgi:hypothetical protein